MLQTKQKKGKGKGNGGGVESCNEKVTCELRFKVGRVCHLHTWGNCYKWGVGRGGGSREMPDKAKE